MMRRSQRSLEIRRIAAGVALLAVNACASGNDPENDPTPEAVPEAPSGNTVIVNAVIYTMDVAMPQADAIAYDAGGTILAVGSRADVEAGVGVGARVVDAGGRTMLPGFVDAHVHVPEAGLNELLCGVDPGKRVGEYVRALTSCMKDQPGDDWFRAAGASIHGFEADGNPRRALDAAFGARPVLVLDDLGHGVWTNTAGLRAAGIGERDADPQGGAYGRNADGSLNGLLLENAQQRVRDKARFSDAQIDQAFATASQTLAANGITTISDAGGFWSQGHADGWLRAESTGALRFRAANALYLYPDRNIDEQLAELRRRFKPEGLVRFDQIKIYLDGILDLGTAHLLSPYVAPPNPRYPRGLPYFDPATLVRYCQALDAMGYTMHFHAVGDAAVREALTCIEKVSSRRNTRHHTTHNYLIDPSDIPRFAQLGVWADIQLGPESGSDDYVAELHDIIGDRADRLIPVADLARAGASISLSSDWDADPLNPFETISNGLTRSKQKLPTLDTALRWHTADAARVLGLGDVVGTLARGKKADLVILDRDPHHTNNLRSVKVRVTVFNGKTVFGSL